MGVNELIKFFKIIIKYLNLNLIHIDEFCVLYKKTKKKTIFDAGVRKIVFFKQAKSKFPSALVFNFDNCNRME